MKRYLTGLLALGLMLTACQTTETVPGTAPDGNAVVTVSLTSPDALVATRSLNDGANSAKGGFSNVSLTDYNIRYQLAVYRVDGETLTQVVEPQVTVKSDTDSPTYELSLAPYNTYKFIGWADFVTAGSTDDLHYDTSDLTAITCKDGTDAQLNDESRDAYYVSYEVEVEGTLSLGLTLTRPFAKLRIVTDDYAGTGTVCPDAVSVSYYGGTRFTSLNAITGEVSGETLSDSGTTAYTATLDATAKDYSGGLDAEDAYRTLVVDYLLAEDGEQSIIHFTIEATNSGVSILSTDVSTNVPLQRNYLTSVTGSLLTVGLDVSVDITDDFSGELSDEEDEEDEILEVTVAEFLEAEDSETQKYQLTGVVTSITSTTYGNLYLKDDTGSVYVYGVVSTDLGYGYTNDKSFADLGVTAGDTLTIVGYRYTYNDVDEVNYAYYVSHVVADLETDYSAASGSGTYDDPYNATMAIKICNEESYTSDAVYVKGIISSGVSISTSYGNASYYISDDGSTDNEFYIYRGYSLGGDLFTSASEIAVGDTVIVYGTLTLYGTTPEMASGNYIVYLNGEVPEEEEVVLGWENEDGSVTDLLNNTNVGVTGTTYTEWTGLSLYSDAVYAGKSAGNYSSVQLRTSGSTEGIVSTTSGGNVTKVTIEWNTNTSNGRVLNVYGSTTAYTAASELYSSDTYGTLLGTITYDSSSGVVRDSLVIDGSYQYVGLRSNSSAMYLDAIEITWSEESSDDDDDEDEEVDYTALLMSLGGTWQIDSLCLYGGSDPGNILLTDKTWCFNNIAAEKDNRLVVTPTAYYITGTVDYTSGDDGEYWDYIFLGAYNKESEGTDVDVSEFYNRIPHGESSYSIDATYFTITFTQDDVTSTAAIYAQGSYTLGSKTYKVAKNCIALAFSCAGTYTSDTSIWYSDYDRIAKCPRYYLIFLSKASDE